MNTKQVVIGLRRRRVAATIFFTLGLLPAVHSQVTNVNLEATQAAAAKGDARAEYKLARIYEQGQGVQQDYVKAAGYLLQSADQGYADAEVLLGSYYGRGRGVPRNLSTAVSWYRKAADQGDAGAQGTLGLLYSVGMGVQQDYIEAYYWLSLAAAIPGPNQQRYVTNRQSVGEHITTDQQQAVEDRVAAWKAAHPRTGGTQ